ncbi:hypothetical protein DAERI_080067 [Deinococcus aerius]|uniref:Uncharacterized protein n=1 Tax=Deinococcus aerius TaxID=200253 RepID=A0A2I9D6E9_9DEIO|nr:hypothetical protein [Deinococcus aerius]GBF06276.1 hypothetical protein DAERI_080067 [Deinococcus aerius]
MAFHPGTCLLTQTELLDLSFMEHRAQLLAVAAFLDRLDRAKGASAEEDFRLRAFREALEVLTSDEPGRVKRAQMLLSDQNLELLDLRDSQSAFGASRRSAVEPNAEVEQ